MLAQILWGAGAIVWLVAAWVLWCRRDSPCDEGWAGTAFSRRRLTTALAVVVVGAMAVVITAPSLRAGVMSALSSDSLFTLAPWQAATVAALSVLLSLAGILLSIDKTLRLCRRTPVRVVPRAVIAMADIVLTGFVFAVIYSVVPQLYYETYRMIIPGLPDQWVVRSWLDLPRLTPALSLPSTGRLAELAAGLVFWTVLVVTLWFHAADYRMSARRSAEPTACL